MGEISNYYLDKTEPNKSCLLALRDIIRSCEPTVTETIKYGSPCFIFSKKVFCYLMVERKTYQPYILFCEGRQLDFPDLDAGDRKRMKVFRVDPNEDIPIDRVIFLINEALNLYRC